jgi:hypothetical protein
VPAALAEDPSLSRDEWALLALVDGHRTVGQIVALAGRGEFAVVSALAELVGRGLLRLGDGDELSDLLRAHELLATLEDAPVPGPRRAVSAGAPQRTLDVSDEVDAAVPDSPPASDAANEPDDELEEQDDEEDDDEEGGEHEDADAAGAVVTPLSAAPSAAGDVTPRRPEPFLPKRTPDHPEEPMPAVAAVAGGAASPTAAALIERDPSVNKSLLLRLIAGVRGL